MNYALAISSRVEDQLLQVPRDAAWTEDSETAAYKYCVQQVIDQDGGRTWAEGNIRVGDYILILDSDTRIPQDCFLDAITEMECSPEVAILQYISGVMNVTGSYFENGVSFLTSWIYSAIQYAVANGDVCPFMGHNAFLRWSAIQDISYTAEDGTEKYWNEETVSEVIHTPIFYGH